MWPSFVGVSLGIAETWLILEVGVAPECVTQSMLEELIFMKLL